MVDAGTAQIVLGNHEFNAVGYATLSLGGGHLRPRITKNVEQHAAFIAAVGLDSPLHREFIDWFMTIPLWLELDGLRVIHACWSASDLSYLRDRVSSTTSLTPDLVVDASTKGHPAYAAVETLIKGPEVELPDEMSFPRQGEAPPTRRQAEVVGRLGHQLAKPPRHGRLHRGSRRPSRFR